MSVMADKNPGTEQQQQQPPPNWQYNMYNMYSNPYMVGYGNNPYFQYYARMGYMGGGPPMQGHYRGFTPGGQLMPFMSAPPQPQQQPQPPPVQKQQVEAPSEPHSVLNNSAHQEENKEQCVTPGSSQEKKELELPPLPPGPPPPVHNGYASPQQPTPPRFFQPTASVGGTIRFSMNTARARINLQKSAFNQERVNSGNVVGNNTNIGGGGGNRRRKNKKNKQQQQQQLHQQQDEMMESDEATPPLPPTTPPPLPPPPPSESPVTTAPATQLGLASMDLDDWPPSLKGYVNRCYAKCSTVADKDRMGVILKTKILKSTNDGALWIKDWLNEPLPLLESEMSHIKLKERLGSRVRPPRSPRSPSPRRRRNKRSYRSSSSESSSSSSDENYISFNAKNKTKNINKGVGELRSLQ